jgi:1-deoxy-D-xylulose-5-phosphate synthase
MGAGHASTSIGYAVGLKEAMRKGIGEDGRVAAVIGDGALTGGVAYEALHAAGGLQTPIVIVLNDNGCRSRPTSARSRATSTASASTRASTTPARGSRTG